MIKTTNKVWLGAGDQYLKSVREDLVQAAKDLSVLTGKEITFRFLPQDNDCSIWGDYGVFEVKDPIPCERVVISVNQAGIDYRLKPIDPPV